MMDKYSKLMKSSLKIDFLNKCFKNIKEICSGNLDKFKWVKTVEVNLIMHNVSKMSDTLSTLPV